MGERSGGWRSDGVLECWSAWSDGVLEGEWSNGVVECALFGGPRTLPSF